MLQVEGLQAWYGESHVLHGVDLEIHDGQIVTLIGRNGAGKTTTIRSIMGIHRQKRGRMTLDGVDIASLPPQRIARLGVGYVQDDRGIYSSLTVHENLVLPPVVSPDGWDLDKIYDAFPPLRARARQPGTKLSGGEQQMLAIARVLRMGARLLLLDEPTEGLAPILVQQIAAILRDAKTDGRAILLVEQNLRFATAVADRHYLLSHGTIVATLGNDEVRARESELLQHLGI